MREFRLQPFLQRFSVLLLLFSPLGLQAADIEASFVPPGKGCTEAHSKLEAGLFIQLFESRAKKEEPRCVPSIWFSGEVDVASIALLKRAIIVAQENLDSPAVGLRLNSPGGDLRAALDFGRWLRTRGPYVFVAVNDGARCASACIAMLAGGVQRVVSGEVVIHRPYFTDSEVASMGYTDLQKLYLELEPELRSYFRSVNISERVVDVMWSIPSHRGRPLTLAELSEFGLDANDAIWEESGNAAMRNLCGPDGPTVFEAFMQEVAVACTGTDEARKRCWDQRKPSHPGCTCFEKVQGRDGSACISAVKG
jgi:hypothetical protein